MRYQVIYKTIGLLILIVLFSNTVFAQNSIHISGPAATHLYLITFPIHEELICFESHEDGVDHSLFPKICRLLITQAIKINDETIKIEGPAAKLLFSNPESYKFNENLLKCNENYCELKAEISH